MNTVITTKNLSVWYGDHLVFSDVFFQARDGEFVSVVGTSGSGKSTFLHALAGFVSFSGYISIPKHIGMVFQQYAVFPWMTVSENISFGLSNIHEDKRRQIVEEHLRLAELVEKRDRYPAELSGGQVQRVALARTLAHNPDVLLMDEPYGALDAHTRDKMHEWLLRVWSTHRKTVIFVTHNIEEALFLSDRVLVLRGGSFTKEFPVSFPRPRNQEIKFSPEFTFLKKEIYQTLV